MQALLLLLLSAVAVALPLPGRALMELDCTGTAGAGTLEESFTLEIKTVPNNADISIIYGALESTLGVVGEDRLVVCLRQQRTNIAIVNATVYATSLDQTINPLSKLAATDQTTLEAALGNKILKGYPFCLNALHINDQHSRILPISRFGSTCSNSAIAAGSCFGGAAIVWGAFSERRQALMAQGKHVLVLDAGDVFSGTAYFTLNRGELTRKILNAAGIVSMQTAGNHEFDLGPGGLRDYLSKIEFPFRSHNVDVAREPLLNSKEYEDSFYPNGYEIFTFGRGASTRRVAVIGITTETTQLTSSPGANVVFRDSITLLQSTIPELKRRKSVDHVIVVSHSGQDRDVEIAQQVPGISLIIGGHSHDLLAYGRNVTGPDGHSVPIVQSQAFTRYLGETELCWAEGSPPGATLVREPISLAQNVFADNSAVAAIVAEAKAELEPFLATVVGQATAEFSGSTVFCRTGDCKAGLLIANGMLASSFAVTNNADFALQNGGGTRGPFEAGDITVGDVLTVQPFSNELSACKLTGATMLEALEYGIAGVVWDGAAQKVSTGSLSGRYPQLAGIKVLYDPSAAPGSRIVSTDPVLDSEATYTLLLPDFILNGGDGYAMFVDGCTAKIRGGGVDADVLKTFIAANSPIDPNTFPSGTLYSLDVLQRQSGTNLLTRVSGTPTAQPQEYAAARRRLAEEEERTDEPPVERSLQSKAKRIANARASALVQERALAAGGFPCVTGTRGFVLVWGICGAAAGHVIEKEVVA